MSEAGIRRFSDLMRSDVKVQGKLSEAISADSDEEKLRAILDVAAQYACDFTVEEACVFFESSSMDTEDDAEGELSIDDLDAVAGGAGQASRDQDAVRSGRTTSASAFKRANERSSRHFDMLSSVMSVLSESSSNAVNKAE